MASVPRARPASPRGRSYSVLWATGADSLDSHRPTSAPLGWSACGLRWSISRTIGHGGSNILGRSSSPSLPGKLCVGYHWMKRMGLARSLVQQISFKAGCCAARGGVSAASAGAHPQSPKPRRGRARPGLYRARRCCSRRWTLYLLRFDLTDASHTRRHCNPRGTAGSIPQKG